MTELTEPSRAAPTGRAGSAWPLVQMVGLAPLLAVSTSAVKGTALGLATLAVLVTANGLSAALQPLLVPRARRAFHVMICALAVTCLDWLVNATFHGLHAALGVFLPLIVANAMLHWAPEPAGAPVRVPAALADALGKGVAFVATLAALGALREIVGTGRLFADLDLLNVPGAAGATVQLPFDGALIALSPAGGFFGAAALLALRQYLAMRASQGRAE